MVGGGRSRPARLRLPRGGEFSALWLGEAASVVGDQLAKVAVALIVFDRTGSAALSGVAYGANFLAPLVAGPLVGGLSDRHPRRTLMVSCLLLQACCVGLIAVPGMPIAGLVAGTMTVAAVQVPFKGAQGPLVRQVLADHMIEHYGDGTGVLVRDVLDDRLAQRFGLALDDDARNLLYQPARSQLMMIREIGQLAGLGGAVSVVLAIGTSWALLIDAATFLVAAVLLRWRVRHRPAAAVPAAGRSAAGALAGQLRAVWRMVRTDRAVRLLTVFVVLIGFTAAPDAVVVPLVTELGAPRWTVGMILAADCVGVAGGAWWLKRQLGARQARLIGPLAVLSMAPMAVFWVYPALSAVGVHPGGSAWWVPVAGVVALLVVSGVGAEYFSPAVVELTERVDNSIEGTTNSLVNTLLRASQGLGAITAGIVAGFSSAVMAVAAMGSLGVLLTGVSAVHWRRLLQRSPQVASTAEA